MTRDTWHVTRDNWHLVSLSGAGGEFQLWVVPATKGETSGKVHVWRQMYPRVQAQRPPSCRSCKLCYNLLQLDVLSAISHVTARLYVSVTLFVCYCFPAKIVLTAEIIIWFRFKLLVVTVIRLNVFFVLIFLYFRSGHLPETKRLHRNLWLQKNLPTCMSNLK